MHIIEMLSNIYFDEITDKRNDQRKIFNEYKDIIMFLLSRWSGSWEQDDLDELEEIKNGKNSRSSNC